MASIYPKLKDGKIVSFKFKSLLYRDETGKQVCKCKTWKPSKNLSEAKLLEKAKIEAALWEKQLLLEIKNESVSQNLDLTLEKFVKDYWLDYQKNVKENKQTTIQFYNDILKIILPKIGKIKMINVSHIDLENYMKYIKNDYRSRIGKKLSPKSIKHHYRVLCIIFKYAVKQGIIVENPLEKVLAPKLQKSKVNAFNDDEVRAFLTAINNLPIKLKAIYYLLLTTGLRRGECFGLMWKNIDFANMVIEVERNVVYTFNNGISVDTTKTQNSKRKIPITPKVKEILEEYKLSESLEHNCDGDAFLFHAKNSCYTPHNPTYITRHMIKLMDKIGLPKMSPHDLRHTCASMLLKSGADIKSVQDILGHADASTTLNFYVKSDINNMRKYTAKAFDFNWN